MSENTGTLKAVVVGAGGISGAWFTPLIKEGVVIPAVVDLAVPEAHCKVTCTALNAGCHDPVYNQALEMTGQVHGLNYLKTCRGGNCVPNPVV